MGAFSQPTWQNICAKAVQRHVRESIIESEAVEENLQVWNRDGRPGGVDTTTCHFEGKKCLNYPINGATSWFVQQFKIIQFIERRQNSDVGVFVPLQPARCKAVWVGAIMGTVPSASATSGRG